MREKSVLIVEPNSDHGEVLPSLVYYFSQLGYAIDLIITPKQKEMDALVRTSDTLHAPSISIMALPFRGLAFILRLRSKLRRYRHIVLSTEYVFRPLGGDEDTLYSIFDHLPVLLRYREQLLVVVHRSELMLSSIMGRAKIITLAELCPPADTTILSPYVFGTVDVTPKSERCTNFIVVGSISAKRKNIQILVSAIQTLRMRRSGGDTSVCNFHITIVGVFDGFDNLPAEVREYVTAVGRVDYPTMYRQMEEADFFLPLLDPDTPEHDRYITSGISGSFGLIYGFHKPCIIHKKFATKYRLTNNNSLIYDKNEDLAETMQGAINMSAKEYSDMQYNLGKLSDELKETSLSNLKKIVG